MRRSRARHNNIRDDPGRRPMSAKVNRMVGSSRKAAPRRRGKAGVPNVVASGPSRVADGRRN
jgi:hypothetical protein